ncbi:MaoC family dehydratase [Amycolatopsis benzoatilytica]|uniref:MaoC family dehydratase n=1 Tax=Amycolatopsis benzoatilytica TaxID=346045 RepID=UPI0003609011|nr:MaoC/PaaZ C-terminal domain-containing protein [Amycolatopsis benzoatilytica]
MSGRAVSPIPEHLAGHEITFRKTVAESDVYGFAGITGDFAPNHVDEQFMAASRYGGRIAHGVLVLGFSSTASTQMAALIGGHAVSLGYDRIRFVGPVRIGDTVTVTYRLASLDQERRRAVSDIEITNQRGETVLVGTHVLAFV